MHLPFHQFEGYLRVGYDPISLPSPPAFQERVTVEAEDSDTSKEQIGLESDSTSHTKTRSWTPKKSDLTALGSLVHQPCAHDTLPGPYLMHPNTQIFTSTLHRQVLCSVANNFAGLSVLPVKDVICFLQKETKEKLYHIIRFARGYTSRAIIQFLFHAAVEMGDAKFVDQLIREHSVDIRVNQKSIIGEWKSHSPIERATILQHAEVVKTLLYHGADVKSADGFHGLSALYHCVIWGSAGEQLKTRPKHREIFRCLLEAGADLPQNTIKQLLIQDSELAELFISAHAHRNAAKWSKWGTFRDAIKLIDHQRLTNIVEIMLESGADLNYSVQDANGTPTSTCTVIDAAAQRGNLPLVNLLFRSGALLTDDTLPCAVESQNEDLILLLLQRGADVNKMGSLYTTPLAAAIKHRSVRIFKLLEDRGALIEMHLRAALLAASEVGDTQFLERLPQLRGKISRTNLGYALGMAIRGGRDELATWLINAGADANVNPNHFNRGEARENGPPLFEALKRQKKALVFLLLDADASPCYQMKLGAIELATAWGSRSVLKALIFAGADVNDWAPSSLSIKGPALTIAVKRRDFELIELLLASGANINHPGATENGGTALEAAVDLESMDMVDYLLNRGADPNDPWALRKAFSKNNVELFNSLFDIYRSKYPVDRGMFGVHILVQGIEKQKSSVVRQMLTRGVNANMMMDYQGRVTPFGRAIDLQPSGSICEWLELFLQNGCNPNDIVSERYFYERGAGASKPEEPKFSNFPYSKPRVTAFLAAISMQNVPMVELFLRYEADVNFPTHGRVKRTPLQRATEVGNLDMVDLLLNHGANVHAPAAKRAGGTALQLAAIKGFVVIACKLLDHGADVNAPGSSTDGRTALEGAAEHGRLDMVQLLLNAGAGSRPGVEEQITNAVRLAKDNGFQYICDLIEDHLKPGREDIDLELLADVDNEDPFGLNLESPFTL